MLHSSHQKNEKARKRRPRKMFWSQVLAVLVLLMHLIGALTILAQQQGTHDLLQLLMSLKL